MAKFKCPLCKKILERDSDKKSVVSFCEAKGKNVRMKRVKE